MAAKRTHGGLDAVSKGDTEARVLLLRADRPLARWSGALALGLSLHAGAIVATLAWASRQVPASPPPAAMMMMIELAPVPAAPPAEDKPAEKPPEKPPEKPLPPEPPKSRKVEVPPPPKPKPKPAELALPRPEPQPERTPSPAESLPAPPAPPAPVPAAPAAGPVSSSPPSTAVPSWQGAVLAHLEKHKRYPRAAQSRRQQGVGHVAFTIDRQGAVLALRLHKSSGHDSLDQETLDLLHRAQPLPPPPADLPGERIELLVPVQFHLR